MGFAGSAIAKAKAIYQSPAVKRITCREAEAKLRIPKWFRPANRSRPEHESHPDKQYSPPGLRKLEPEQASLLLLGLDATGDQGTRDLLELVFPEPGKPAGNLDSQGMR